MHTAPKLYFEKVKVDLLIPFLQVRKVDLPEKKKKDQLVSLAYNHRDDPLILEIPSIQPTVVQTKPITEPVSELVVAAGGDRKKENMPSFFMSTNSFVDALEKFLKKKIVVTEEKKKMQTTFSLDWRHDYVNT